MTMGAATIPDVLVSTDWVAQHLNDTAIRIVEVDVDTAAYDQGHVPNAIAWNWTTELCDTLVRDIIPPAKFEALMAKSGISNDTTVILYGDNNNWFAAWALWQMKVYGHQDVRIMNGGRKKWLAEGRELGSQAPSIAAATYRAACRRPVAPRVPAGSAGGREVGQRRAGRRAQPGRVHRRDPRASRPARNVPARRPHPWRQEHPVGQSLQRGRHVQESPTTCGRSTAAPA